MSDKELSDAVLKLSLELHDLEKDFVKIAVFQEGISLAIGILKARLDELEQHVSVPAPEAEAPEKDGGYL